MPEISYPDYLALEELLALQRPRATPEHPDELLFIVVHQASELWFKVIIQQLHALTGELAGGDAERALWHVQRINTLMRIVAEQLSSLDTLPPQRFRQFRDFLGASSGQQSVQFRLIGALSGLRDEAFVNALKVGGEIPVRVREALSAPRLEDLFVALVNDRGKTLESLYTGPGPDPLFFLAEALLEYDQAFQRWRFLHVQLVERTIGLMTGGTGGTMGARYLGQGISQRFFPALWAVRAKLFSPS
ncbi:MAG TPA: tryptophan 2,3-dioxygenase family protein [Gemmatimonadaceae bacterium]|nr:tryptophan 2,3-dioxygenase family protein [Gemmatimonadaceae bacterium]